MEKSKSGKKRPFPSWMKAAQALNTDKAASTDETKHQTCKFSKPSKQDLEENVNPSVNGSTGKEECSATVGRLDDNSHSVSTAQEAGPPLTAADIISQSMPLLQFEGSVVYSNQSSDCSCICEDILSTLSDQHKTVVGFDMEWPVTFVKGAVRNTSLIQMCIDKTCYLFHVSAMQSFPKMLGKLIEDDRLVLTGVNIEADLWKLARDFDVQVKTLFDRGSVVELGKVANKKLKSSEKWSLEGLCRNVLKRRLNKDGAVRCGNWDEVPLQKAQQMYAATDAYAGLRLYTELSVD